MRSFLVKALVLTGVISSTWAITSTISGQFPRETAKEPSSTGIASSKRISVSGEEFKPPGRVVGPSNSPAHSLKRFQANVQGKFLNVEAEVEIFDRRPGVTFVWALYVFNAGDGLPRLVNVYDHQAFKIPASGELRPTFRETVELPSGNYQVILALNHSRGDVDVNKLKDPGILRIMNTVRGIQDVHVD